MHRRSKRIAHRAADTSPQDNKDVGTPQIGDEGRLCQSTQLPPELLAQVLLHLDLRQRMTSAVAVSKAWRDAAAATITDLTYKDLSEPRLRSMLAWIASHGSHLTQMQLWAKKQSSQPIVRQLQAHPSSKLQVLELWEMQLQLGPGRGNAGVLAGHTALTSLTLRPCRLLDGGTGFKAVSVLTSLQDLRLAAEHDTRFPSGVLLHLVQLTKLKLCVMEVPAAALRGLSLLSGLKQLTLWPSPGKAPPLTRAALRNIVQLHQLTNLSLGNIAAPISNSSTPGFSRLTALQVLSVQYSQPAGLHPEVLTHMTGLQELVLTDSFVLGGVAGVAELLAVLPSFQQLRKLCLMNSLQDLLPGDDPVPAVAAQYSALTSSSQLSSLALTGCMLPDGAWAVLFNRQLPQLRSLILNSPQTTPLSTADLRNLAGCCRGLQSLCVTSNLDTDADLSALQDLSQLTNLNLNNVNDSDARTALARLTQLQELWVMAPNDLTARALLELSGLRQLTRFVVYQEEFDFDITSDFDMSPSAIRWWMESEIPPGGEPDVWKQMLATLLVGGH